jgi:hypothetical protein
LSDTPVVQTTAAIDFEIGYRWQSYGSNLLLSIRVPASALMVSALTSERFGWAR